MLILKEQPKMEGVLLVDKPAGWTSHDVCAFLRKRFGIKKVGHAGTLDPLATGLLVILLGRATKFSNRLSQTDKVYFGTMRLGVMTDSHDATGKVIAQKPWDFVTLAMIREHAKNFTGEILQTPPMVSALKHQGVRLYKLARQGKTVPREQRRITVYEFNIEKKEEDIVFFSTRVSKGTYVRTLIHDLGVSLDSCASLASLRRTHAGEFSVQKSASIDHLKNITAKELTELIIPPYSLLHYANSM